MYGPCVYHDGVIHANNNFTLNHATNQRLLILRQDPFGEIENYDVYLRQRHKQYFSRGGPLAEEVRRLFTTAMGDYLGAWEECVLHHADPHPKKSLRVQAFEELCNSGLSGERAWLRNGRSAYKNKPNEWAKATLDVNPDGSTIVKPGRGIGDLGTTASLQGAWLTMYMKEALTEPIHIDNCTFVFCKQPSQEALLATFAELWCPAGRSFFVAFSDDSCFCTRDRYGKVHWYNVDISKCDASHTPALFDYVEALLPGHAQLDWRALIEQLEAPIEVRAPERDAKRKIVMKMVEAMLLSGSTITTVVNTVASLSIGLCLAHCANRAWEGNYTPTRRAYIRAVEECGYLVDVERCEIFEDVQFLKNSPVRISGSGNWGVVMNIGVLLRTSGVCKGDLPGRGPLEPRARRFQHLLCHGMYPRTFFTLIERLKRETVVSEDVKLDQTMRDMIALDLQYRMTTTTDTKVDDVDLYRRYRLTSVEVNHLNEVFGGAGYGTEYCSTAADKILRKDYGLRSVHS